MQNRKEAYGCGLNIICPAAHAKISSGRGGTLVFGVTLLCQLPAGLPMGTLVTSEMSNCSEMSNQVAFQMHNIFEVFFLGISGGAYRRIGGCTFCGIWLNSGAVADG